MAEFFNKNLKYLRNKKNISQQNLSEQVGIDRSTISRIENNEIETTIDNAIKIAEILNVSVNDLISKDLTNEENNQFFNELEILFNKAKDKLDSSQVATIKFVMNDAINKYKNNNNQN